MAQIKPKLLLIQGGYSNSGVGEQFTESMITGYPKENITRFSIITSNTSLGKYDLGYSTTTFKTSFSAIPLLSSWYYWKFRYRDLVKCAKELTTLIKAKNVKLIWVILNDLYTIQLMAEIIKDIDIPIIAQIWDVPEYKADQCRIDSFSKNHLLSLYREVLMTAKRGVTVSDSMGRIYAKKYGLNSFSMVFCPPEKAILSPSLYNSKKKEINVVFAGSLYAYVEWNAFLEAIEINNSSESNIKINVRCIGNVSRRAKEKAFVTYEKIKPVEEAAIAINKADIAYLPYWMAKKFEFAVQTAFPSKLSLYVASGTPVFYHGPLKSTPTEFLHKNKVGIGCHSLIAKDIIYTIHSIISDKFQKQYKSARAQALEDVFHSNRSRETFVKTMQLALLDSKSSEK